MSSLSTSVSDEKPTERGGARNNPNAIDSSQHQLPSHRCPRRMDWHNILVKTRTRNSNEWTKYIYLRTFVQSCHNLWCESSLVVCCIRYWYLVIAAFRRSLVSTNFSLAVACTEEGGRWAYRYLPKTSENDSPSSLSFSRPKVEDTHCMCFLMSYDMHQFPSLVETPSFDFVLFLSHGCTGISVM